MSQISSKYSRKANDAYPTPAWVTQAVASLLPDARGAIWEPACGEGHMVTALEKSGHRVAAATDVLTGTDFLSTWFMPEVCGMIVTNPPYSKATQFVEHALTLSKPQQGVVAMLLRVDFDSGKTRRHLFRDCPAWACKLILLERIAWFTEDNGKPKASPSENHAWYIWDYCHTGDPIIKYAGRC